MNINDVMKKLEQAARQNPSPKVHSSTGWVIYLADKGKNSCDKCLANHGRKFKTSDLNLPQLPVHPNCRCRYEETQPPVSMARDLHEKLKMQLGTHRGSILLASAKEPTLILPGNTRPQPKYYVDGKDFNADRIELENKFGVIIDSAKHTSPKQKISTFMVEHGFDKGMKKYLESREGRHEDPYFDGKDLPTIGIGANMTQEYVLSALVNIKAIDEKKKAYLENLFKDFKHTDKSNAHKYNSNKKRVEQALAGISLSQKQIDELYEITFRVATNQIKEAINRGGIWEKATVNNEIIMVWKSGIEDETCWGTLPDIVKGVCCDISFTGGANVLSNYVKFNMAIKAHDWRRAAIELIDAKDYRDNINNRKTRGLAYRRRDAAIELSNITAAENEY